MHNSEAVTTLRGMFSEVGGLNKHQPKTFCVQINAVSSLLTHTRGIELEEFQITLQVWVMTGLVFECET